MEVWVAIITGFFGSAGLFSLLQFIINRYDTKHDNLAHIAHQSEKAEKDACRTQLLLLIKDFPDAKSEIMEVAHHYFVELKGNWFATEIFRDYLKYNGMSEPAWFQKILGTRA